MSLSQALFDIFSWELQEYKISFTEYGEDRSDIDDP